MFLVKNRGGKEEGEKRISDIFADLQRLTNGIKGQWRFSGLLRGFLVVLLSEAFFFIFSLWYIRDKCPSDYNCGHKIM